MSTSQPSSQTAAARRAAEAQVRELVARIASAHQRLVASVRRHLRGRLPSAHELVYEYRDWIVISFSPNERGYEGALAIRASANGVELHLNRGKDLPDPEKLLRGSGKQVRSIPLEGASTLARPAVVRLVDEAIADHPVPFARAGRGPLVIRSAAAGERPRRRK
jgi:hypothetical protein